METTTESSDGDLSDGAQALVDITNSCKVPLYHVETEVLIQNNIAELKFLQFYYNNKDVPIEAGHAFPVHRDCTFTSLKAYIGDVILESRVEERKKAREIYEEEVKNNKVTALAEPVPRSNDMMTIKIGNIPAKTVVVISCVFHQVMEVEDLSWNLHIPKTIHPRYQEIPLDDLDLADYLTDIELELYPNDKESIEDCRKGRMADYYSRNFFDWNITIKIKSQSPITRVISTSHEIETIFLDDQNQVSVTSLKEIEAKHLFKRDFSFLYRNREINKPTILVQQNGDQFAMMVSFLADCTPEKEWDDKREDIYNAVDLDPTQKYEDKILNQISPGTYTFIVDVSGSMSERDKIKVAKEA